LKPTFSMRFVVPFGDVDMMGHVNNVRYLAYFENARVEHLYSMEEKWNFEEMGLILAHAEIDYKSRAGLRDELRLDLRVASVGNTSWVYEYEILNEHENRIVATGKTVQVAYDYKEAKPVPIPAEFKRKLQKEVAESQK
jgi:acyl-CoA thioester hydrolase